MRNIFTRFYAVAAKTAVKSRTDVNSANMEPLPFFRPTVPTEPMLDMSNTHPEDMSLTWHPYWKRPWRGVVRSVDFDHRKRYDTDGRSELFEKLKQGSIIVVEQVSSLTQPRRQVFSGILMSMRKRGIASSFTIRSCVLKTNIELMFPLYSPLISRIIVLKEYNTKSKEIGCKVPFTSTQVDDVTTRWKEAEHVTKTLKLKDIK